MKRGSAVMAGFVLVLVAACAFEDTAEPSTTATSTIQPTTTAETTSTTVAPDTTLSAPTTSTSTSTSTSTTVPSDVTPAEPASINGTVLIANDQGIYQIDSDTNVTTLVEGEVASAVDDTLGGLLFQNDSGRRCIHSYCFTEGNDEWSTVIWWIPRGSSTPQQLLVPTPETDHELTLHDTYRTNDGFAVVYTRHEGYIPFQHPATMFDRLRIYDLETRGVQHLYTVRGYEWDLEQVTAGAGLIAATESQMSGTGCILVDSTGSLVTKRGVPTSPSCFDESAEDPGCPHSCALSSDGTHVAYIEPQRVEAADHYVLVVRETATGTESARIEVTLPIGGPQTPYALSLEGSSLLINRFAWRNAGDLGQREFFGALRIDLGNPDADPQQLPIAGRARLVVTPIDIDSPITLGNQ